VEGEVDAEEVEVDEDTFPGARASKLAAD
jgi:hypothetical protein